MDYSSFAMCGWLALAGLAALGGVGLMWWAEAIERRRLLRLHRRTVRRLRNLERQTRLDTHKLRVSGVYAALAAKCLDERLSAVEQRHGIAATQWTLPDDLSLKG